MAVVFSGAPSLLTLCLVLCWSPFILTLFGRLVAAQEGTPLPGAVDQQHQAVDQQQHQAVDQQHQAFEQQQHQAVEQQQHQAFEQQQHQAVEQQQHQAVDQQQHQAVDQQQHQAVDQQQPVVDQQQHQAVDQQHQAVEQQHQAVEQQHQAVEQHQAVDQQQHPVIDQQQQPAVDQQHQAVDQQRPTPAVQQHPAVDQKHPEARYATVQRDFGYIESLHDTSDEEFSRNAVLQHEFRVPVDAGASQCYYQKFPVNAVLYVSFQVVRGLDRYMELLITGPGNEVLEHIEWSADASMQKKIPVEGVYRLCLKNDKSQFSSKLVYFSLLSYKEEEIHEHRKNIQDMFDGTQVIEDSVETVDKRMKQVHLEQALSRRHVISDWYLLRDNNSYVQIMSVVLCCVIVVTSAFQVFFVRRLFNTGSAMGKKKPRA